MIRDDRSGGLRLDQLFNFGTDNVTNNNNNNNSNFNPTPPTNNNFLLL